MRPHHRALASSHSSGSWLAAAEGGSEVGADFQAPFAAAKKWRRRSSVAIRLRKRQMRLCSSNPCVSHSRTKGKRNKPRDKVPHARIEPPSIQGKDREVHIPFFCNDGWEASQKLMGPGKSKCKSLANHFLRKSSEKNRKTPSMYELVMAWICMSCTRREGGGAFQASGIIVASQKWVTLCTSLVA